MKKQTLFVLWGGLFVLCVALGFIPAPAGALKILLTLLSILFFLPPALLLHRCKQAEDRNAVVLIRNFSAASLALTAVLIIANFLSALAPAWLGNVLHGILVVVSAPMVCSGYWALSLFLWACLMVCAIRILK